MFLIVTLLSCLMVPVVQRNFQLHLMRI